MGERVSAIVPASQRRDGSTCLACDAGAIKIRRQGRLQHLARNADNLPVWLDCVDDPTPSPPSDTPKPDSEPK